ncbi:MAG: hypothetical protein C5B50_11550 [Verrucomicrobia bacterium]|nr:MAG: hypothetical protein C5B50_11550 [Verrucomicrobiota bacterium]
MEQATLSEQRIPVEAIVATLPVQLLAPHAESSKGQSTKGPEPQPKASEEDFSQPYDLRHWGINE